MNKTKKYTIYIVIICFLVIFGTGIYQSFRQEEPIENQQTVEEKTDNTQEEDTQEETEDISSNQKEESQSQTTKNKETTTQTTSNTTNKTASNETKQSTSQKEETKKQTTEQTKEDVTETTQQDQYIQVSIKITGVDETMASSTVSLKENATAYDALEVIANQKGFELSVSKIPNIYVKGINGLKEFDYGPTSGWKYKVNGVAPNGSSGSYTLKDNDQVEWYYAYNA